MPKGKPIKPRTCKGCGAEFQPTGPAHRYCAPSCYYQPPVIAVPKLCRECRVSFIASRRDQKFCSGRCAGRNKARRPKNIASRIGGGWGLAAKGEEGCRNCGRFAEHLHHIVPRGKTTKGKYDIERNGMPLCFDCHRGWHDRRVTITADRLTDSELAFAEEHAGVLWIERNYPDPPHVALLVAYEASRGLPRGDRPPSTGERLRAFHGDHSLDRDQAA